MKHTLDRRRSEFDIALHVDFSAGRGLDVVEIEIIVLGCQCFYLRIGTGRCFEPEIAAWEQPRNASRALPNPFTIEQTRTKMGRIYPARLISVLQVTGHSDDAELQVTPQSTCRLVNRLSAVRFAVMV